MKRFFSLIMLCISFVASSFPQVEGDAAWVSVSQDEAAGGESSGVSDLVYSQQDAADTVAFRECFAEVVPLMDIYYVKRYYSMIDSIVPVEVTNITFGPPSPSDTEWASNVSISWFTMSPSSYGSPNIGWTGEPTYVDVKQGVARYMKGTNGFERSDLYRMYKVYHRHEKSLAEDKARLAAALARFDTLAEQKPMFYATIHSRFGGDYAAYVDALYGTSIFTSGRRLRKFLKHSTKEALQADLGVQHEIGMSLYEAYVAQVRLVGLTPEQLAAEQERVRREQSMLGALLILKKHNAARQAAQPKRRRR